MLGRSNTLVKKIVTIMFVVLIFFMLACEEKRLVLKKNPDPYLDAFRNHGIKYLLTSSDEDTLHYDTTFFDADGNIIRIKQFMLDSRMEYDRLNFLTRKFSKSDIVNNFSIRYKLDQNSNLFERWYEHSHSNWELAVNDSGKLFTVIKYKIDGDGKIVSSLDSLGNSYSKYFYDKNAKLTSIQTFSIKDNKPLGKWVYTYNDNNIERIVFVESDGREIVTHYYSKGLLDSSLDRGMKSRYRYIYY